MARSSRRKILPLKPEVPLQNCFALLTKEERPVTSGETLELSKAVRSSPCIKTSTNSTGDGSR